MALQKVRVNTIFKKMIELIQVMEIDHFFFIKLPSGRNSTFKVNKWSIWFRTQTPAYKMHCPYQLS
jgi:hypothetical protein